MAQQTDAQLTTLSNAIANETVPGGITKEEVAALIKNIIDSKPNNDVIDTSSSLNTGGKTLAERDALKTYIANAISGISAGLTTEQIQDLVAAMFPQGTYDDTAGTITLAGGESGFNRQTGNYTLVLGDVDKTIEMNVATPNNLTVPPNSSVAFPINTEIFIAQYGAGQTTVVAGSGVTIRSANGLKMYTQYSGACLKKVGPNEWYLFGDTIA